MDLSSKSPQQILQTFREILKEAADLYEKPQSKITSLEFTAAAKGRLGYRNMAKLGGFIKLRQYVAPPKETQDKAAIALVNKILGR